MPDRIPNYFDDSLGEVGTMLMKIKGNWRRIIVANSIKADGLNSVESDWTAHDIGDEKKRSLQLQHLQFRGGEDLPDLMPGEIEIARLSLLDSVHGEVTSLRARQNENTSQILLRIVDEWETEYKITPNIVDQPLTVADIMECFKTAEPSPMETECEYQITSFFYSELADRDLEDIEAAAQ